jgi:hypothetical protein
MYIQDAIPQQDIPHSVEHPSAYHAQPFSATDFAPMNQGQTWTRPSDGAVIRIQSRGQGLINANGQSVSFTVITQEDIESVNRLLEHLGIALIDQSIINWINGGPMPGQGATQQQNQNQTIPQVNMRRVPIWYYYDKYRNENPAAMNLTESDFARLFEDLINREIRRLVRHQFPTRFRQTGSFSDLPPVNQTLNRLVTEFLQENFHLIADFHPFTQEFYNRRTNEIDFHVWHNDGVSPLGLVGWGGGQTMAGLGIFQDRHSIAGGHTRTLKHEIGHAVIGAGEPAAESYAERVLPGSVSPHRGRLAFCPVFDNILRSVDEIRWMFSIAWGSEDEYAPFFGEVFGDYFDLERVQLARSGAEHARQTNSPIGNQQWGLNNISIPVENAFFNERLTPQQRQAEITRAQRGIDQLVEIAIRNNLQPEPIVHPALMETRWMQVEEGQTRASWLPHQDQGVVAEDIRPQDVDIEHWMLQRQESIDAHRQSILAPEDDFGFQGAARPDAILKEPDGLRGRRQGRFFGE